VIYGGILTEKFEHDLYSRVLSRLDIFERFNIKLFFFVIIVDPRVIASWSLCFYTECLHDGTMDMGH